MLMGFNMMRGIAFVGALLAAATTLQAQVLPYQSSAVSWYTFDINVNRTYQNTKYDWQYGRAPHVGRAAMNGVDQYIDLNEMPDDNGKTLPALPRSMTFEYWVMWNQLNSWSRILDCGNGNFVDDVILSNVGTSNDFRAAFYRSGAVENSTALAAKSIYPNTWQHIVATIAQKSANDASSATAAEINIYIDGALVFKNPATYLLRDVARSQCWIGKSEWSQDGYFSGWIDDFFVYNYAISAEQVAVHYVLERPPIYELTFSSDPRLIVKTQPNPPSTFTYAWQRFSPTDNSSVAKFHEGHLDLSGDSFIDLTASARDRTSSWVGAEPFPVIGGWAESGASGTTESRGWSIEIIAKIKLYERWAKIFDLGNGAQQDNVLLGFQDTTRNFQFEVYRTFGSGDTRVTNQSRLPDVLAPVVLNQWYQIIIVMVPYQNNPALGSVKAYVDGKLTKQAENFNMPERKTRNWAWIGKSNWGADEFIDCELDAFRIYDYGLTPEEVKDLFDVTHDKIPDDETDEQRDFRYTSWPSYAYTFSNPATGYLTDGTNFTWSAGQYPRLGLAQFDARQRHYVNLQYFPADNGAVLPRIGGSVSFEFWARWNELRQWSRLLDLGARQAAAANNIIVGNVGRTSTLAFEVYNGEVATIVHIDQAIRVNTWHHIVVVADQVRLGDTISAQSAELRVYIDGVERASRRGYLPMQINRPNSFIGRSNWAGDEMFSGSIDAVYVYDYGLTYEQVAAHNLLPRPPIFELAFSKDPRPWINPGRESQFTYSWDDLDPMDAGKNLTKTHRGMLVLDGDQYVNLTSWSGKGTSGFDSVGTGVPAILFNTSAYPGGGSNPSAASGWSVEIIFKLLRMENGAKIFDFSNGPTQDEIGVGFHGADNTLDFFVYNPNFPQGRNFPVLEDPKVNEWYHIMITGRRTGGGTGMGVFTAYVNGKQTHEAQDFPFPRGIERKQCYLGKSPWVEDYIDIRLDTFRIYDFYVIPETVVRLYEVSEENLVPTPQPLYTSGMLNEWTFDDRPTPEQFNGGTQFTWQAGEGKHRGLAHFDGRTEYINLFAFADDTGTPFPTLIGNGSFSFEWWAKFESFQSWSRLIDIGNTGSADNILVANRESSSVIEFHTYLGSTGSFLSTGSGTSNVNRSDWHHIVVTLDDRTLHTSVSPTSNQASDQTIFVDGRQVASGRGYRPLAIERVFAYMGKSHWAENALFQGAIDSFYFFDYALSGEQINVHFRLPRPPIFDLSFSYDPRPRLGGPVSAYTYGWQEYDPADSISPDARFHQGHALLTAANRHFINLSAPVGVNSVGVLLPSIGGRSYGSGNTKEGWSFEFVVKIDSTGRFAKLIDWGNAAGRDNIVLGFTDTSNTLRFQVFNSRKSGGGDVGMDIIKPVVLGKWYHIVITIDPTNYDTFDARWKAYVNGVPVETLAAGWIPRSIVRNSALIGKSNWLADSQMSMKIDAIRVYDYLVSETEAHVLYQLVHDANAIPAPRGSSSSSSTGRSSSSSTARGVSSSSRGLSSSSRKVQWCADVFDTDELDGWYPSPGCFCADEYPDCNLVCLMDPESEECEESKPVRSSTGAAGASTSSGIGTAAVIGIVFAIIVGISAVGYLYMRYCRSGPSTAQMGADGKTSLLGDTRIGVERDNAYTQWVPPSGTSSVPLANLNNQPSHQSV